MTYANIIVDISLDKLDKTFQYAIPSQLQEQIHPGVQVDIPLQQEVPKLVWVHLMHSSTVIIRSLPR